MTPTQTTPDHYAAFRKAGLDTYRALLAQRIVEAIERLDADGGAVTLLDVGITRDYVASLTDRQVHEHLAAYRKPQ